MIFQKISSGHSLQSWTSVDIYNCSERHKEQDHGMICKTMQSPHISGCEDGSCNPPQLCWPNGWQEALSAERKGLQRDPVARFELPFD